MLYTKKVLLVALFSFFSFVLSAQTFSDSTAYVTLAGGNYAKPTFYRWLFGNNLRNEWSTPISVKVVNLDSIHGGLKPYKKGGGNESKSLRLRNANGKEFVMRSISKSRKQVIPPKFRETFIGDIIQDGVSMSHPYAALAIPPMLSAVNIPHSKPIILFIPPQAALDTFNAQFGNDLYILEERPDGDWSDEPRLGNFKKFISTLSLLKNQTENNNHIVDQQTFIKGRLFDILISDWDRNHDNLRWGIHDTAPNKYVPIPRDRDQAFFQTDGIVTKLMLRVMKLRFMHDFDYKIKNVKTLTSQDRSVDRLFTNAMTKNDWLMQANILKQTLTDSVIEHSIKQLPSEIFSISGKETIEKLKHRRDKLNTYALHFYRVMAKNIEINGSNEKEYFNVQMAGNQVNVKVYRTNKYGQKEEKPYFERLFNAKETKKIMLNGFGGNDEFSVGKIKKVSIITNPDASTNSLYKLAEED